MSAPVAPGILHPNAIAASLRGIDTAYARCYWQLQRAEQEIDTAWSVARQRQHYADEFERTRQELEQIRAVNIQNEEKLAQLQDGNRAWVGKERELERKFEEEKATTDSLRVEIDGLYSSNETLESALATEKESKEGVQAKLDSAEEECRRLRECLAAAVQNLEMLQKEKADDVSVLNEQLNACEQSSETQEQEVSRLTAELSASQKDNEKLKNRSSVLEDSAESRRKALDAAGIENRGLKERLGVIEDEKNHVNEEIIRQKTEIAALRKAVVNAKDLERDKTRLETEKCTLRGEVETEKARTSALAKELSDKTEELEESKSSLEDLETLRAKHGDLKAPISSLISIFPELATLQNGLQLKSVETAAEESKQPAGDDKGRQTNNPTPFELSDGCQRTNSTVSQSASLAGSARTESSEGSASKKMSAPSSERLSPRVSISAPSSGTDTPATIGFPPKVSFPLPQKPPVSQKKTSGFSPGSADHHDDRRSGGRGEKRKRGSEDPDDQYNKTLQHRERDKYRPPRTRLP